MTRRSTHRKSPALIPPWKIKLLGILTVSAIVLSGIRFYLMPRLTDSRTESVPQPVIIKEGIKELLGDFGIQRDWIDQKTEGRRVRIPGDLPIILPCVEIINKVKELGGDVLNCREDMKSSAVEIEIGYKGEVIERITLIRDNEIRRRTGKMALIIDDFGYFNNEIVEGFLNLPQQLTFSIIPGLKESTPIARRAAQRNREVMIHLPMESLEGEVEDDGFTILTRLSEKEISNRVQRALREIPYSKGLNNHKGSKATLDERVMKIVLEELKKAGYYFVDSRTNPASIAYKWGKEVGLACGRNETFIDIQDQGDYIREKLQQLVEIATRDGHAIGIGHVRSTTLQVLQEELPKLEKRGIQLVTVSEVVQ